MIVAHDSECPALCHKAERGSDVLSNPGWAECVDVPCLKHCHHHSHACTCRAAEQLRELVEAAKLTALTLPLDSEVAFFVASRMNAALAPFLPEQKEEPPRLLLSMYPEKED